MTRVETAKRRTPSASLAIGTATIFVALAALVSLLSDDPGLVGHAWRLRGTLVPSARADALVATASADALVPSARHDAR